MNFLACDLGGTKVLLGIFKKEINNAEDKEAKLEEKLLEFTAKFATPYIAAERGYVDDVIKPSETKLKLINALQLLKTKVDSNPNKKHSNIPL